MMQKIKIQLAIKEQIPKLVEIAEKCFSDPWSEPVFLSSFENEYTRIYVAMQNEEICGYLVLQMLGDEQSVDDIAVLSEYRRQGIAENLLQKAHREFSNCNFILEVREHNTSAISLYQKLFYKQVGYRKRYYTNPTEGAVLMTRKAERNN